MDSTFIKDAIYEDMIYPVTDTIETLIIMATVVLIAWFWFRHKRHQTEQRTELMMRALEHSDNAEEIISSLQKPRRSIRERVASSRAIGLALVVLGGASLVVSTIFTIQLMVQGNYAEQAFDEVGPLVILSLIPLAIGIGFLIYSQLLRKGQDNEKAEG